MVGLLGRTGKGKLLREKDVKFSRIDQKIIRSNLLGKTL